MGSGVVLTILALQTAVFWGQYSTCRAVKWQKSNYVQCNQHGAMVSACFFAVFMFLTLLGQLFILFMYKDAILGEIPLDEGVGYSKVISLSSQDTVVMLQKPQDGDYRSENDSGGSSDVDVQVTNKDNRSVSQF